MTGRELKEYRKERGLTQVEASRRLGVSQTYLSLLENGGRRMTARLERKAARAFGLDPTELPALVSEYRVGNATDDQLTADLSALGYPGFSHYKPARRGRNPADVLLSGLLADQRDARLVEAMPWVALRFYEMDWPALVAAAKLYDLQNRLGFVATLAKQMAEQNSNGPAARKLRSVELALENSRLAKEGTLCNEKMTNAERRWLAANGTEAAMHWNLLSDLSPQYLGDHYVD